MAGSVSTRKRILFVAENVSLAQVVRLRVLSDALDPARYELWFASSGFDPLVFEGSACSRVAIHSMSAARMQRRIAFGRRLYDEATLAAYVDEDLATLERLQPALVVGDLRLSLAVAAPKLGVPYASLVNAYWSPHRVRARFPVPEHPLIRLFGAERVAPHLPKAMPWVFDHFARPVNALRRRHGLPEIGSLREVLCFGDYTLYPDVPELTPLLEAPSSHHFLGPVLWSPDRPLPEGLGDERDPRPLVYVTLGSTGDLRVLRALMSALATLPVRVLLATAGRFLAEDVPANTLAADFVPGQRACQLARLVICNGGSSTAYQALYEGVPVLGLPMNFDQSLSMADIELAGAGRAERPSTATAETLRATIEALLDDERAREAAQRCAQALRGTDASQRFRDLVTAIVP